MEELLHIAEEIDAEYEGDLEAEERDHGRTESGMSEIRVFISGVGGDQDIASDADDTARDDV